MLRYNYGTIFRFGSICNVVSNNNEDEKDDESDESDGSYCVIDLPSHMDSEF
jgi:hypothetical protein